MKRILEKVFILVTTREPLAWNIDWEMLQIISSTRKLELMQCQNIASIFTSESN